MDQESYAAAGAARAATAERKAELVAAGGVLGALAAMSCCILPLVLFGTPEQKQQYLPRLLTGELIGAYALSESGSGSDALAAKTRATKSADGSWSLTGEKMWISNGGFADVIIVFAKVDGEHFTAFIVERAFPGVSSGKEEHKMGLHGSSTTPIVLPGLKPNQPNHRISVPMRHDVMLWPGMGLIRPPGPYFPIRGPSTRIPASAAHPPI